MGRFHCCPPDKLEKHPVWGLARARQEGRYLREEGQVGGQPTGLGQRNPYFMKPAGKEKKVAAKLVLAPGFKGSDMDTLAEWLRRRPAKPMGWVRIPQVSVPIEAPPKKGSGTTRCWRAHTQLRYSLAGQDTRLSPERPRFESRWRNAFVNKPTCVS